MLIDWFTVAAQAINFLILVWLLKRFLYQPILDAIDARERRIATELADASANKAEAQNERDEFQRKNEEFDRQQAALLGRAVDEAKAERQRLLDNARKEAEALGAKLQESLKNEQLRLNHEISARAQQEIFAIVRKVLADLAATSLEERMAEVFVRRLHQLNSEERVLLTSSNKSPGNPAIVRSAFGLPHTQQDAIKSELKEILAAETQIRFEAAPDLVSGIELISGGYKVAWSITEYLSALETNVGELLKEKSKSQPG